MPNLKIGTGGLLSTLEREVKVQGREQVTMKKSQDQVQLKTLPRKWGPLILDPVRSKRGEFVVQESSPRSGPAGAVLDSITFQ